MHIVHILATRSLLVPGWCRGAAQASDSQSDAQPSKHYYTHCTVSPAVDRHIMMEKSWIWDMICSAQMRNSYGWVKKLIFLLFSIT